MKRFIVLSLALIMAACSPRPATDEDEASVAATSGVFVSAEASVVSESTSSLAFVVALSGLPDPFIGTWDANPDACRQKSSDMRLIVDSTTLRFHESRGTLTSITLNTPGDIAAQAAMAGEGEKWDRPVRLVLSPDSNTLTLDDGAGGVRVRCS